MKTKLMTKKIQKPKINWDKTNLVQSDTKLILTNGIEHGDTFQGVVLHTSGSTRKTGEFREDWVKDSFELVTGSVTIEFNPE